jgi:methylenetetrahydrofolate reductase (NADPH)
VLAMKQQAGAEFAITQMFFRVEDYERLLETSAAHGCTMPIVPGIIPVTNVSQIERFSALQGSAFPAELAERFGRIADDPDAVVRMGIDVAAEMCQRLLEMGAPGLHFYTLNRSHSTIEVYQALGLGAATG